MQCHAKIDTGMGRIGFLWESAADVVSRLSRTPGLKITGLCTHFASADDEESGFADIQVARFYQVWKTCREKGMPVLFRHVSNSSGILRSSTWDMDGVICEECPIAADDDGPAYLEFLQNARPFFPPRPHTIPLIVTARMETYRPQTEAWLRRHGVKWDRLVMGHWSSLDERNGTYNAGEYKGRPYLESGLDLFIESCPIQSKQIHEYTGKRVICPTTGEVFG